MRAMTVPGKGGRPCLVSNPHVAGEIVSMIANGSSQADAARALKVSASTVSRVVRARERDIEEMRREIQERVARKVLKGADKATQARLDDASDVESRTGPQSYRAVMEAVGVVGGVRNIEIHGDVDASVSVVDARSVQLLAPEERHAALREARERLGIG